MNYELIITRTQPPCGGKPPKLHEFKNVSTSDPIGYVFEHESKLPSNAKLEVHNDGSGTTTITFERGAQHVIYEFTED